MGISAGQVVQAGGVSDTSHLGVFTGQFGATHRVPSHFGIAAGQASQTILPLFSFGSAAGHVSTQLAVVGSQFGVPPVH